MTRFAIKTLLADKGKLLIALTGVAFSLLLVNVQGGLFLGLMDKASVLIDHCPADIWVAHRNTENVDLAHDIPETWLNRIRGLQEVAQAEPYVVGKGIATLADGGFEDVWIIGSDPKSMMGSGWSFLEGTVDDLRRPYCISYDTVDDRKLGAPAVGDIIEINRRRATVVARTSGIQGFMTTPYLFAEINTAREYSRIPAGFCSFFLVRARPGSDHAQLAATIQGLLPETDVHTAAEFRQLSKDYWLQRTGIGVSFGAATLLGLLVGLVMVAQSLYALVLDHLMEFATLKAIGAGSGTLLGVVLLQAVSIAMAGSIVGVAVTLVIAKYGSTPLAPILIPQALLFGGIGVVFTLSVGAALLPLRRLRAIDTAIVLQGGV